MVTVSRQILSTYDFFAVSMLVHVCVFSLWGITHTVRPYLLSGVPALGFELSFFSSLQSCLPLWSQSQRGSCTQETGCQTGQSRAAVTGVCPSVSTDVCLDTTHDERLRWRSTLRAATCCFLATSTFLGFTVFAYLPHTTAVSKLAVVHYETGCLNGSLFPGILSFPGTVNILSVLLSITHWCISQCCCDCCSQHRLDDRHIIPMTWKPHPIISFPARRL